MKRRAILRSAAFASAAAFLPLPGQRGEEKPFHILVTGAHPDDPETGCGGTIAQYAALGHKVDVLYFTRGEAGIDGLDANEAARTREREAQNACAILNASPSFYGQIDGNTFVNAAEYEKMNRLIEAIGPDIVFTHWPIDTHRDHRHVSLLVYGAWLAQQRRFALYYYEVLSGKQTQTFHPTDYCDISAVEPLKRNACYAHTSQQPEDFYRDHLQMSQFRGLECGCAHAEAFVRQTAPGIQVPTAQ